MVAIVTGNGLGLERGSAKQLGIQLGSAFLGRGNDGVTVNAATGNLVIQNTDEVLVGRGLNAVLNRSYNSLGAYTNLDGSADADNWIESTQRKIVLTGTGNVAGSTGTLTDWDGSVVTFTYDAGTNTYKTTDNAYRYDKLTWSGGSFELTRAKSDTIEVYSSTIGGRIVSIRDFEQSSGTYLNRVNFQYDAATTAGKLTQVLTLNSTGTQYNYVDLSYDGSNRLIGLVTSYYDVVAGINKTLTRTRYGYDTANRLSTVTVDLSPGDSSVTDNNKYTFTYGYKDSTSKLVTSLTQSDGTSLAVTYDGSNRVQYLDVTSAPGVTRRTTFTYDTVNRVTTITDALSNVYKMTFDTANQLTRLEEPAPVSGGNPTIETFEYNANGDVTRVLTFDNAANVGNPALAIAFVVSAYDANGNLLERVDGVGQSARYTYGTLNEVLTETHYTGFDPDGLNGVTPSGAMVIHYVYDDGANNGINDDGTTYSGSNVDDIAEKHVRFRISAEGRVTEYRYDGYGQLLSQIDYAGTAYTGSTWTESALATWVSGTADKTQAQRTDYVYDFRGNLITATSYSQTDSTGAGVTGQDWSRVTYVYDQFGKLLSRLISGTNALGGEATPVAETFLYDGLGRMISTTDVYGQTTMISIVDSTRTNTISTPNAATHVLVSNIAGELLSDTESGTNITTGVTGYAYDALGRLRLSTDAAGVNTYYVYDKQNRLTGQIDGDGSLTEFKYDGADRLIATVRYATSVSVANLSILATVTTNTEVATIRPAVSASDRWSWTIYNRAGQILETIDAAGAVTTYSYDGAGRATGTTQYATMLAAATVNGANGISGYRTTPPTATVLPTTDGANDRTARVFYDNDGLMTGTLDADGYLVEILYDKVGRKIETIGYTNVTSSTYWAAGTFAQLKGSLTAAPTTDIHNYWLYDGRGRVGATIDGEGNVTRYHYTARGQIDQQIVGQKVTASTSYTLATLPAASGTLETTRFYYNAAGQATSRVRTLTSGTETTAYSYDTRGRLLTEATSETISTESRTITYRYDVKGRLIGQIGGIGSKAMSDQYGANPTEAQKDIIFKTYGTRYVYDTEDRLVQKIEADGTGATDTRKTLYYYDGDGQLRFEINALGEVTEYRYNPLGDLGETIVYGTRLAAGTLAALTGGLVNTTVTNAAAAIANASLDSRTQYAYNVAGRRTTVYDPLYPAAPTADHYTAVTYNAFGEVIQTYAALKSDSTLIDVHAKGYNRRGLDFFDYRYMNYPAGGGATGALQESFFYDAFGQVVTDQLNNTDLRTHTYLYDRANRLTRDTDTSGVDATNFAYDARSNLLTRTDRAGKVTTFSYDLFNRNVTTTTPEGVSSSVRKNAFGQDILITDGAGRTTTYTYDKDGNLKTVTDAAGTTTYNYDNADRLVDTIDAKGVYTHYTYDLVNRVLTRVEDYGSGKLNLTTTYAYDAKGQEITVTDPALVVTNLTYNLKGQMTRVVQDAGAGKLNIITDYVYRTDGKVLSQTDAVGTSVQRVTTFEYDSTGRLTKKIEDQGSGKLNVTTQFFYDVNGNVTATVDALNRTTRYVYDKENRLKFTVDAEGQVTEYGYDKEGRGIWTRQYVNVIAAATLAGFGNEITAAQVTANAATNTNDRINRTIYDGDGRVAYSIDAMGFVTKNAFDGAKNIVKTWVYAAAVSVTDTATKATLDGLVPAGDPSDAVITNYTYDGANRLTDVTDATGMVTHYVLDAVGQVTDVYVAYGIAADEARSTRVYDNVGRITSEKRAVGKLEEATAYFGYDALGRITSITDPRGFTTTRTYDNLGRMLSETVPLNASENATTSYTYDARGNRVTMTDPRLNVGYFYYDGVDRLTLQMDPEGYVTKTEYAVGDKVWRVTRYYNKASNYGSVSATNAPSVNAHGSDAVTLFTYDKVDRLKTSTDAEGGVESYNYDALGNVTSKTNQLGGVTNYAYDKRGLLSWERPEQVSYDSNGNVLASNVRTDYFYDARGNLITKIEAANTSAPLTTSYGYDKLDRLTSQTDPAFLGMAAPLTQYQYDKRGNLILQIAADGGKTYSFWDRNNRKVAEVSPVNTLTVWAYDGNGNILNQKIYSAAVAFPANPGGAAPTSASAAREVQYEYDRNNRLIRSTTVNVRIGKWDTGSSTYVTNANQSLNSYRQYDAAGNVIKETDANGSFVYHYYDKNGREIAKVDQEGYLTTWDLDTNGNAKSETRFANRYTGTPVVGGTPPTVTPDAVNDRTTSFTYDRMGRRLTEVRNAVLVSTISGTSVSTTSQAVSVAYTYNAMGEVKSKLESTGDKTEYQYDTQGRVERQLDAVAADFNSSGAAFVRHVTYFYYDANNNLVRTVERAETSAAVAGTPGTTGSYASGYTSADDHVTRFGYSGRVLQWMIDASNGQHNYWYDLMGRQTHDYYQRLRSDGTYDTVNAVYEGTLASYDLAGRMVSQWQANYNNSGVWVTQGPITQFVYDQFGGTTARYVGGYVQESFTYDNAGKVVKTTGGDGVQKFFVYDANGNVTLQINSNGRDMTGDTVDSALTYIGATLTAADAISTITLYDKRNMTAGTREPNRTIANVSNTATTVTQTLTHGRTYNAFGEVASETDARGNVTSYSYNTMGRVQQKQSPWVNVTDEYGASTTIRPTENYAYDASGRLVGVQDANLYWNTRTLLGGTGYGDKEAKALKEFRPDTSVVETRYDAFGNARVGLDGLGRVTTQTFDKTGHITQIVRPSGFTEGFGYDLLGQRVTHWNNLYQNPVYGDPVWVVSGHWEYDYTYGYDQYWVDDSHWETPIVGWTPAVETTDYDIQGRVTKVVNFNLDVTTTTYSWAGTVNSGMGLIGAWTKSTSFATGHSASETVDTFGRLLTRTDEGGHVYSFTYNRAGQLANQTSTAGQNIAYTYFNTGKMATMTDNAGVPYGYTTANIDGTYTYDADGNRTYEKLQGTTSYYDAYGGYIGSSTVTLQEGQASWDALNRLTMFTDPGTSGNGTVLVMNQYDAVGNLRRTMANHGTFTANGALSGQVGEDYWYKYDPLNRMTLVKGQLVGGQIVRGAGEGRTITYDLAGERASQSRTVTTPGYYDPYIGYVPGYVYESRENYTYNLDGLLTAVNIATGSTSAEGTTPPSAGAGGTLRVATTYDIGGRVTGYTEYAADGTTVQYNRYGIAYDWRNNITSEASSTRRYESDGFLYVNYSSTYNSYAAGGVLLSSTNYNYRYKNGTTYQDTPDTSTTYTYDWWDAPQQKTIAFKPNTSQSTTYNTTLNYDVNGHLASAYISDGRPRQVTYVNDANGQVLLRTEADNIAYNPTYQTGGDPKQAWWYFDGKQVGTTGNNGNADPDFATQLDERVQTQPTTPGPFRLGSGYASTYSDFDQAYNSLSPGEGGGYGTTYSVRGGDTLQSIAQAFYGDSSLWYMIADANGLRGGDVLAAGRSINVPSRLANIHNTSNTFRPYDSAAHIGDLQPTTPAPPKPANPNKNCGVFGTIMRFIVSQVVKFVLSPITKYIRMIPIVGNALANGLERIVSQGINTLLGLQDHIDWKEIGMKFIGDVVDGVLTGVGGPFNKPGIANAALKAVVKSGLTQGVAVATGLQKKFDWAGVAVAGVTAGVTTAVGQALNLNPDVEAGDFENSVKNFVAGAAGAVAGAATQSVIDGSDFGDNVIAALPDVALNTIGAYLASKAGNWVEQKLHDLLHPPAPHVNSTEDPDLVVHGQDGQDAQTAPAKEDEIVVTGVRVDPRNLEQAIKDDPTFLALGKELKRSGYLDLEQDLVTARLRLLTYRSDVAAGKRKPDPKYEARLEGNITKAADAFTAGDRAFAEKTKAEANLAAYRQRVAGDPSKANPQEEGALILQVNTASARYGAVGRPHRAYHAFMDYAVNKDYDVLVGPQTATPTTLYYNSDTGEEVPETDVDLGSMTLKSVPGSPNSRTSPVTTRTIDVYEWAGPPQVQKYHLEPEDHIFKQDGVAFGMSAQDHAAFNGAFLASVVNAATGGSYEAAGYVVAAPGGGYTTKYDYQVPSYLPNGTYAPISVPGGRSFSLGYRLEAILDRPVPPGVVGFWHTHPLSRSEAAGNLYLSPGIRDTKGNIINRGDAGAAQAIVQGRPGKHVDGYLRGGDGVFRVVRNYDTYNPFAPVPMSAYQVVGPYILNGDRNLRVGKAPKPTR